MARPKSIKPVLVDPVSENQQEVELQEQEQETQSLAISELSIDDFQPIPVTAAKQAHPFDGYPQTKMRIGSYIVRGVETPLMINKSWIVALTPKEDVHQDPSGLNVTIRLATGKEKIVDYKTSHNRIVKDQNGDSVDIVFDREIIMANGKKMSRVAICPDHTARSQILFKVDKKTGKVNVDKRYVLADIGQVSRLRRLFEMFNYQQTQSERLAKKFDEEPESKA